MINLTTGEKKPIITKGELMKQIEEIKKLLELEWQLANQDFINSPSLTKDAHYGAKCDFIRYLQDQVRKIIGGLE